MIEKHKNICRIIPFIILGMGLGVLITYPLVQAHPLRWGISLVAIGLLAHLFQYRSKIK